ncbi:LysR family transcriptional regulator [Pragia fontium]|uniref:DNA-binding transcriptional regulator, LysR family n=2 Tax=Pragia fontium TaxID=82985 RepID=A0AAJ4WBD6_9GAMM|nr:LysR family transcriptional regulator [Pragia fontium]GKX61764.1 LysR family transcriptional regulator [Pragia fontium]SFC98476.1 DNA-binding transcriptional regulator, LysR family [Pragia fontium DSM 5563 = ATCC 49100]VEJ55341.1 Morphology and auto-aggregation control protein [Pragia fontium]
MAEPWRRLPALSLKQIQYFVTLASLRHFTDTANQLAISQPALSSAIRHIETVLGGKVVHRTAQALTLTELGVAILPHAERLLNIAHSAFDDIQRIVVEGGDGTVKIGLVPSVSSLIFPSIPELIAEQFPTLRVEFHDRTNDGLLTGLESGALDFGIGALDSSVPGTLEIYPLLEDEFVAITRKDDPLAESQHIPWRMLVARHIALFSKGNISRMVASMAETHRLPLKAYYHVDFLETLYGLVRSKLAVAILPRLYTTTLCDPELVVLTLQQPQMNRSIALMRATQSSSTPLVDECFKLVLARLRDDVTK